MRKNIRRNKVKYEKFITVSTPRGYAIPDVALKYRNSPEYKISSKHTNTRSTYYIKKRVRRTKRRKKK